MLIIVLIQNTIYSRGNQQRQEQKNLKYQVSYIFFSDLSLNFNTFFFFLTEFTWHLSNEYEIFSDSTEKPLAKLKQQE